MFSGNKDIVEDLIFHSADIEAEDIKGYGQLFFFLISLKPQNMCNKAVTCSYVNISYISDTLTFLLISYSYFYGFVCDILLLYVYIKRT